MSQTWESFVSLCVGDLGTLRNIHVCQALSGLHPNTARKFPAVASLAKSTFISAGSCYLCISFGEGNLGFQTNPRTSRPSPGRCVFMGPRPLSNQPETNSIASAASEKVGAVRVGVCLSPYSHWSGYFFMARKCSKFTLIKKKRFIIGMTAVVCAWK